MPPEDKTIEEKVPPGIDRAAWRAFTGDMREALKTSPAARRAFAFQLRELCGVFEAGYVPGEERAARQTEYNEGRRFVGLMTLMASGARLDVFRQFEGKHGERTEDSGAQPKRQRRSARGRQKGQEADGGRSAEGREKAQGRGPAEE